MADFYSKASTLFWCATRCPPPGLHCPPPPEPQNQPPAGVNLRYLSIFCNWSDASPRLTASKIRFGQPGINYSLLPRTLSALRRLPLAPETAAFQRQLPGTGLPLHVDPSNFVLGCHVGMVIPPPAGAGDLRDRRHIRKKRVGAGAAGGGGGGGGFGFGVGRGSAAGGPKRALGGQPRVNESGGAAGKAGGSANTIAIAAEGTQPGAPPPSSGGSSGRVGSGEVGERAWIEVAGEKRHWEAGRAFVFDPSFLHRTNNPTLGERIILNIDIWHPGLQEVEQAAVRRVCELIESWNERSGLFEE